MKFYLLVLLCLALASCDSGTNTGTGSHIETHPYFATAVGDEYTWRITDRDTTYERHWKVTAVVKIDSFFYQLHVSDPYLHNSVEAGKNNVVVRDSSYFRVAGERVFSRIPKSKEDSPYLAFDIPYEPGIGSTFGYVRDTSNVVVPAGTFSGKIMRSDNAIHIHAPQVGLIYSKFMDAEIRLLSAKIGGRSYP